MVSSMASVVRKPAFSQQAFNSTKNCLGLHDRIVGDMPFGCKRRHSASALIPEWVATSARRLTRSA